MEFTKAVKNQSKLRIALSGAAGSVKTYSALQLAKGIGGRIAVIDTERGSASLYAGTFDFDVVKIEPPYSPEKYIEAITLAEKLEYSIIIIDSLSHAWAGSGGLLDIHDAIQKSNKGGNSFTAWKEITPIQNKLIDTITGSKCHIITTMRAKQDYVVENNGQRNIVRKVGLAPVQREGVEYEFTIFIELSQEHVAVASKDRTNLFDGKYFVPSDQTGKILVAWLNQEPEMQKPQTKISEVFTQSETSQTKSQITNATNATPQKTFTIQDIAKSLTAELKMCFNQKQITTRRILELWQRFDGKQEDILQHLSGTQERRAA